QSVLDRGVVYVALIDERALRYPVGGPDVMAKQLEHLIDLADKLVMQVVPANCGTYVHLDGSFIIATVDGREYVYVDTPTKGILLSDQNVVSQTKERWDLIRAEALSRRQTVEFIREVAEEWNRRSRAGVSRPGRTHTVRVSRSPSRVTTSTYATPRTRVKARSCASPRPSGRHSRTASSRASSELTTSERPLVSSSGCQ